MSSDASDLPQQWQHLIREAAATGRGLALRGGGSKAFTSEPLPAGLAEIDTRAWQGIVSYEPSELVVTVRAGTPLAELEAALAARGQCLPFEPPHFAGGATVGGMVAAGLSGPARASAGSVRDHVLGVRMINGRGELLTFGGQVMKNVAGYDVSRLMAGSQGVLGLITEVSLKVLPLPAAEATLALPMEAARAVDALHRWCGQPLPLHSSCWVRDDTQAPAADLLFVRMRGAAAAVQAASARLLAEAGGQRVDDAQAAADWAACRDLKLPFFTSPPSPAHGLWRLSVGVGAPWVDLGAPQLIEWHGALRWVWAPESQAPALHSQAQALGGHAALFVAPAERAVPPAPRQAPQGPALARIHQQLKAEFDPAGIFNPGRLALAA